jgi:hypothetical protein
VIFEMLKISLVSKNRRGGKDEPVLHNSFVCMHSQAFCFVIVRSSFRGQPSSIIYKIVHLHHHNTARNTNTCVSFHTDI